MNKLKPNAGPPYLEPMFSKMKEISVARMKSIASDDNFVLVEERPSVASFGHWLGLILVSGPGCRIVFKCFFASDDIRAIAAKTYQKEQNELSLGQVHDFVREFCNLTAGGLVKTFTERGLSLGISLPIIVRGFDDIFYDGVTTEIESFEDFWKLNHQNISFVCGALVEVIDKNILERTDFTSPDSDDSEVDFL